MWACSQRMFYKGFGGVVAQFHAKTWLQAHAGFDWQLPCGSFMIVHPVFYNRALNFLYESQCASFFNIRHSA